MHDNKFNDYRVPSGMLIVFLEKALTLIHMETHLDDVSFTQHYSSRVLPIYNSYGRYDGFKILIQVYSWLKTRSLGPLKLLKFLISKQITNLL